MDQMESHGICITCPQKTFEWRRTPGGEKHFWLNWMTFLDVSFKMDQWIFFLPVSTQVQLIRAKK